MRGRDGIQLALGAFLILVGALWAADRAGWVDTTATAVLAAATLVVGLTLMARARYRGDPVLVLVGTVLATVTALTAAAPIDGFQGGLGDRTIRPLGLADLEPSYELGAGSLVVDLRRLDWQDRHPTLRANVGFGDLVILLPSGAAVDVRAQAAVGEVIAVDRADDGLFLEEHYRSEGFDRSGRRITIEANVFMGSVAVVER